MRLINDIIVGGGLTMVEIITRTDSRVTKRVKTAIKQVHETKILCIKLDKWVFVIKVLYSK